MPDPTVHGVDGGSETDCATHAALYFETTASDP